MLEKVEPPEPPEGYFVSAAFRCIVEASHSICSLTESPKESGAADDEKKRGSISLNKYFLSASVVFLFVFRSFSKIIWYLNLMRFSDNSCINLMHTIFNSSSFIFIHRSSFIRFMNACGFILRLNWNN